MSLKVRVSAGSPSALTRTLYKCAALRRAVHDPSVTERPLREEKGISSGCLSQHSMTSAVESNVKTCAFLPLSFNPFTLRDPL